MGKNIGAAIAFGVFAIINLITKNHWIHWVEAKMLSIKEGEKWQTLVPRIVSFLLITKTVRSASNNSGELFTFPAKNLLAII